jgi:hypothetical protein
MAAMHSRRIAGVVLLLVAGIALLERYVAINVGQVAPLLIGVAFLVWSLLARHVGLLVPAGILIGVGAGLLAERFVTAGVAIDRALFLGCLAGGFALITLLAKLAFRQSVRWPLIPGLVLAVIAVFYLAGAEFRQAGQFFRQLWPFAALVVAGWLLLGSARTKR